MCCAKSLEQCLAHSKPQHLFCYMNATGKYWLSQNDCLFSQTCPFWLFFFQPAGGSSTLFRIQHRLQAPCEFTWNSTASGNQKYPPLPFSSPLQVGFFQPRQILNFVLANRFLFFIGGFSRIFWFWCLKAVRFAARNSTFKIRSQRHVVVINKMCATKGTTV